MNFRTLPLRRNRPARAVVAAAAASVLTLGLAACSGDDSGESGTSASQTGTTGAAGGTETGDASDDQGTWPRSVDSVVVSNGKATKETEKVEIPAKPEKIVSTAVTLTGSLLAVDAPVVASGGANVGPTSDDKGFFTQWAGEADDRGVKALWQLEPDLQKVAAEDPDLILVSASGADTATAQYEELKKIGVPVVVLDYSDKTWGDITTSIGEITGHEAEAADAIQSYDDRVREVTEKIEKPEQPVNVVIPAQEGAVNFFTAESAQGEIVKDLGWDLDVPGDGVARTDGSYAGRTDVRQVTAENADKGLVGKTVLGINVDGKEPVIDKLKAVPNLAGTYAVSNDRVFELAPSAFRIDYFSAMDILDQIEDYFAK
ncbi:MULTISPECIES: Fe2+-enterobactin ABC transporter substrate-binding protein [Corynebacterium]|jgi:iron complex transport system substrate-binding protein|uniref:Ferrienterobactin-binding periplasmic protein n=1 Tax=Corynebacterium provencense TaxID=1737425 RepID=A0A2Z3YMH1_9CORY|nr:MULTISPECIES: Fe2+-enterobactin ABC transporter substrate-binding protein [Corynebacterium]AWT25256.1 Ferrienterobactin-binding periplasmic protein [Corynebacterium provencense]MCI1255498.1 Fe2+-enterobactin ABC transporter substrate-binding protein [Corynebacterium provencense]